MEYCCSSLVPSRSPLDRIAPTDRCRSSFGYLQHSRLLCHFNQARSIGSVSTSTKVSYSGNHLGTIRRSNRLCSWSRVESGTTSAARSAMSSITANITSPLCHLDYATERVQGMGPVNHIPVPFMFVLVRILMPAFYTFFCKTTLRY